MTPKPDSSYPCYGHDCYDQGNYNRSCPMCDFFKCVQSEHDRIDAGMTDAQWRDHIIKEMREVSETRASHTHTIYTFDREIRQGQKNPNSGLYYSNFEDVLADHLSTYGSVPIVVINDNQRNSSEVLQVKADEVIGFVVDFNADTVDVELTNLGEHYRDTGFLDQATISFCFMADGDRVQSICCANAVYHGKDVVVVFDCDDVLLEVDEAVYGQLQLNHPTTYNFAESGQYSPDELLAIRKLYGDPEIFKIARFAHGSDKIKDLEKYHSKVKICTRSYNEAVQAVKEIRLPEHTKVSPENIEYQIGMGGNKEFPNEADIVVEDCLENLLKLPNQTVKILIHRSHNQREFQFDFYHKIWRMPDLDSALEFIEAILKDGTIYDKRWREFDPNKGPYSMICR